MRRQGRRSACQSVVPADGSADSRSETIGRRDLTGRRGLLGPLLVSSAALVCLFAVIDFDPQSISALATEMSLPGLVLLLLLFGLQQTARAIRIGTLVPTEADPTQLLQVVLWHQFCLQMLPFRAGEFTLPEFLARFRVSRTESLAALVVMRLLDLLVASSLLMLGLVTFRHTASVFGQCGWSTLLLSGTSLVVAVLVVLGLTRWARHREPVAGHRVAATDSRIGSPTFAAAWEHLQCFARQLAVVPRQRLLEALTWTLLIGLSGAAFSLLFCCELVPTSDWRPILLIVLMMPLLSQIPLRGIAGVGTTEAYLVVLFSLAGLEAGTVLALAICARLFHLGLIAGGALVALAIDVVQPRKGYAP